MEIDISIEYSYLILQQDKCLFACIHQQLSDILRAGKASPHCDLFPKGNVYTLLGNTKSLCLLSLSEVERNSQEESIPFSYFSSSVSILSINVTPFTSLSFTCITVPFFLLFPHFLIYHCTCYNTQGIFLAPIPSPSSCVLIFTCVCVCVLHKHNISLYTPGENLLSSDARIAIEML